VTRYLLLCAAAATAAGCAVDTGLILEVEMPQGPSSVDKGVASLEFKVAHQSWCERWVTDPDASPVNVDVSRRDLAKSPYELFVRASTETDLKQPLWALALVRDAAGMLIGWAPFGQMSFTREKVLWFRGTIALNPNAVASGPSYVADDGGCVCLPGEPWIGNGLQKDCDLRVPTSYDRLVDTLGCELPANRTMLLPVACDGQHYPVEPKGPRDLPCYARRGASCVVATRSCRDQDGVAYDSDCAPVETDPALPDATLCDDYAACEREACSDVEACFRGKQQPLQLSCVLRASPASGQAIAPCGSGGWRAALPGMGNCAAAVLDGVKQPPFTIGLAGPDPADATAHPVSSACPAQLVVQSIDGTSADLPAQHELDLTLGDHLLHVTIKVLRECGAADEPALKCSSG
jgi:hypothetical protein